MRGSGTSVDTRASVWVWDTRGVSPGTYLVEFSIGGKLQHVEKLIVQ